MRRLALAAVLAALAPLAAAAGPPVVIAAEAEPGPGGWRFTVTLRSEDTGWDRYADGWEVVAPDGTRLGHRELLHPHVDEQPFTRSLSGVAVPDGTGWVTIRGHDSVEGWGPAFRLDLPGG